VAYNVNKYVKRHILLAICLDYQRMVGDLDNFVTYADYAHRIVNNTHLLDATEIFRKLNVHKKVCLRSMTPSWNQLLIQPTGVFLQARLPPDYVLLLPLQACSLPTV
jgi:hypothetical protein